MLSLTITRTSLSLASLVISDSPTSDGMWVDTVADPGFSFRYTKAPDSAYVPGSQLLAAVLEQSTLPAVVYVRAASGSAVGTYKAALQAALSQFAYTVTLTVDGAAVSWSADPTWPQWGEVDSGMVGAHMARAGVVIPVNPV